MAIRLCDSLAPKHQSGRTGDHSSMGRAEGARSRDQLTAAFPGGKSWPWLSLLRRRSCSLWPRGLLLLGNPGVICRLELADARDETRQCARLPRSLPLRPGIAITPRQGPRCRNWCEAPTDSALMRLRPLPVSVSDKSGAFAADVRPTADRSLSCVRTARANARSLPRPRCHSTDTTCGCALGGHWSAQVDDSGCALRCQPAVDGTCRGGAGRIVVSGDGGGQRAPGTSLPARSVGCRTPRSSSSSPAAMSRPQRSAGRRVARISFR